MNDSLHEMLTFVVEATSHPDTLTDDDRSIAADYIRELLISLGDERYEESLQDSRFRMVDGRLLSGFSFKLRDYGDPLPLPSYRAFVFATYLLQILEPIRHEHGNTLPYLVLSAPAYGVACSFFNHFRLHEQSYPFVPPNLGEDPWFMLMCLAAGYSDPPAPINPA